MKKEPKAKKRIAVKCDDCGKIYEVSERHFKSWLSKKDHIRCHDCALKIQKEERENMTEEEKEIQSKLQSERSKKMWANKSKDEMDAINSKRANTRKGRTPEQKAATKAKIQATWANKSEEEMAYHSAVRSKNSKAMWENMTEEEYEETCRKFSEGQRRFLDSLTPDEYKDRIAFLSQIASDQWANLTPEEYEERCKRQSEYSIAMWANFTRKERADICRAISIGRQRYWDSITDEERRAFGETLRKAWEDVSAEDREAHMHGARVGYRWWYDDLDEKDKLEISMLGAKYSHGYWDNMTNEEYRRWEWQRTHGANRDNITLNKREIAFQEYLNTYQFNYSVQVWNNEIHPDFDRLFPFNQLTGAKHVIRYHQWDFKIHTLAGDVYVDIDGSIHNLPEDKFIVEYYTKKDVDIRDVQEYNESQRSYQTDGRPAYAVLCYKDKINDETDVLNINTGEVISFKSFMSQLRFMNMTEKEKKEVVNSY